MVVSTDLNTKEQHVWPKNLIERIRSVISTPVPTPQQPEFHFEMTEEAARRNFCILARHRKNLGKAIKRQCNSPIGYGSEFRAPETLAQIFSSHPNWTRMEKILREGSSWPLEELDSDAKKSDLEEALRFGNHKGAENNPELLQKLIAKDVKHGYALPIPLSEIHRLPGALMAPLNIMKQNSIDQYGQIIGKDRMTHDQSYKWGSGTSVNSRVRKPELLPCMFGGCLRRLINWAVAARLKHPGCKILATKIDYASAFRREHLNWSTAIQTCTQFPLLDLAFIALRLTFGGAPGPYEWGVMSETVCDLANAILLNNDWDPNNLHAPNPELVPTEEFLDPEIPVKEGMELIVDIPVDARGFIDLYIDDTIGLTVDIPGSDNILRLKRAILLAIWATARPKDKNEPIPREEMAALNKLLAEAGPTETKMILGWLFDFRNLRVYLPENKYIAWKQLILDMLERGESFHKEIEETIGRLVHLGFIIPHVHHFMSRIRELDRRSQSRRRIPITAFYRADFELMLEFLDRARDGVSMNIIAYRKPTHIYRSDSCPWGLGGYSHEGFAWRWYVPSHLLFRASNNLLEHIASIITPWIDILEKRLLFEDCALSMTDSTTSEGWARKTNFKEDGEEPIQATTRLEVARAHATRFLENGIKDYSQWFAGKYNDVSDALSRDDDREDEELTNILRTFVPEQVPTHFEIVPLPNEIVSWLISLLQKLPVKEQLREAHTRSKLGRGVDGQPGQNQSELLMMSSLTDSHRPSAPDCLEVSPWLYATEDIRDQLIKPWLKAQSEIPFHMWHRPSGTTTGQIQQRTQMASLEEFYNASSGPSETKTPDRSNKRPYQHV